MLLSWLNALSSVFVTKLQGTPCDRKLSIRNGRARGDTSIVMVFNLDTKLENLVFFGFNIETPGEFAATCLGFAALAFFNELLKRLRRNILIGTKDWASYGQPSRYGSTTRRLQTSRINDDRVQRSFATCLYLMQNAVSYLTMLTVMTFNVWLLVSVVAGTVTGHYLLMSPAAGSSTKLASTRGASSVDRQRLLETSLFDSTSEGRERGDAPPDRHRRQSAASNTLGSGTVSVEIHV